METSFPKSKNTFLKAQDFQDNDMILTFKGWERKANEDRPARGKLPATTWQQTLKFCLKYTYPQMATDTMTGEKRLDKNGNPFQNSNYLPEYPHGYTVVYHFEEGVFECGSSPLYTSFMSLQPKVGETLVISKTGLKEATRWSVRRVKNAFPKELPEINVEAEPAPDENLPF